MVFSNGSSEIIRVLIADDHPLIRKGLSMVFQAYPDIQLIAMAEDGQQAVELACELNPDVIVMDIRMPIMDGISAISEIVKTNLVCSILALSSYSDDEQVFRAIKAGAMGYFIKDSRPEQLIEAIRQLYHGEVALQPVIARKLMQELGKPPVGILTEEPLTARENEVLRCLARGLSNAEIAYELTVSTRTVATHVRNILGKLHLANRTQAALYAIESYDSFESPRLALKR